MTNYHDDALAVLAAALDMTVQHDRRQAQTSSQLSGESLHRAAPAWRKLVAALEDDDSFTWEATGPAVAMIAARMMLTLADNDATLATTVLQDAALAVQIDST